MICRCLKAYKVFSFIPNIYIGILPHVHFIANDFILDDFLRLKILEHIDSCFAVLMVQCCNDFTSMILKVCYLIDTFLLTTIMVDNNTLFHFILFDFLRVIHY